MPAKPESALVKSCLDYLAVLKIPAWRNNSTGVFDPTRGAFRSFTGMKGTADILGVLPEGYANPPGRFFGCECKVGRNKLSPDQLAFQQMVNAAGGFAIVVYSLTDLKEELDALEHN